MLFLVNLNRFSTRVLLTAHFLVFISFRFEHGLLFLNAHAVYLVRVSFAFCIGGLLGRFEELKAELSDLAIFVENEQ